MIVYPQPTCTCTTHVPNLRKCLTWKAPTCTCTSLPRDAIITPKYATCINTWSGKSKLFFRKMPIEEHYEKTDLKLLYCTRISNRFINTQGTHEGCFLLFLHMYEYLMSDWPLAGSFLPLPPKLTFCIHPWKR